MSRPAARGLRVTLNARRALSVMEKAGLGALLCVVIGLPLALGGGLLASALDFFAGKTPAQLLAPGRWVPSQGQYTFLPFLAGTVGVTVLSVCLALPLSLGVSVYLTEYASPRFRAVVKPLVDVLAGLPSVIFGLWGMLVIVPFVSEVAAPLCGVDSRGYTLLSAALVLALMITPILVQVTAEVFLSIPDALRQAVFALGATRWEVVTRAVLPKALPGIVAAVILGLARAFGETLAVMMVIGNVPEVPAHPLLPAATFPTFIATSYGEMSSDPAVHGALMGAAFILFVVVVGFTVLSRAVLSRVKRRMV